MLFHPEAVCGFNCLLCLCLKLIPSAYSAACRRGSCPCLLFLLTVLSVQRASWRHLNMGEGVWCEATCAPLMDLCVVAAFSEGTLHARLQLDECSAPV